MKKSTAVLFALLAFSARADETRLPLPEAPLVLVVPDAAALDRALAGGFRTALDGETKESDPLAAAWRRTRVGGKLESQWELFSKDFPLTWKTLRSLQPTALGLSLLSVGDLETVLVLATPLAELPISLPAGTAKTHQGLAYHLVSPGAGDDHGPDGGPTSAAPRAPSAGRRIGLAWARAKGFLFLATSERSLKLALDRALADEGFSPFLPGVASMKLDLSALRKDLYFKREFLFDEGLQGDAKGTLLCALSVEGSQLVEVRQGTLASAPPAAPRWTTAGRALAAAGWEADGSRFLAALRRGFLEPVPDPSEKPVPALRPIPDANATAEDRYLEDLRKPRTAGAAEDEAGELPRWAEHVAKEAVTGWGWEIAQSGARRVVVSRPARLDEPFGALALETVTRRAGAAKRLEAAGSVELQVGPELATLAWKRRGPWLWIAARAEDLVDVPEPSLENGLLRWSQLDLTAMKKEGRLWSHAEGAFSPDRTRPFSDRILGLLGWAPNTTALTVERRRDGERFTERVVFDTTPRAPSAPRKAPAKPKGK